MRLKKKKKKIRRKSECVCVPYDLRTEETEEVATARELEARDQLLSDSGAADEVPAL